MKSQKVHKTVKKKLAPSKKSTENIPEELPVVEKVEEIKATTRRDSFFYNQEPETPSESTIVEESEPKIERQNKKLFFLGFGVFIATVICTLIFGLLFMQLNGSGNAKQSQDTISNPEPTPTPTPATLDRESWTFEVHNGSGVAGAAAKASEKFEKLGYKVTNTGNAEEEVTITELYISKDKSEEETQLLLEDLKSDFGELTVTGKLTDSTASVRIILGKE